MSGGRIAGCLPGGRKTRADRCSRDCPGQLATGGQLGWEEARAEVVSGEQKQMVARAAAGCSSMVARAAAGGLKGAEIHRNK